MEISVCGRAEWRWSFRIILFTVPDNNGDSGNDYGACNGETKRAYEMPSVTPVTTADEILKARSVVREVYLDEKIEQYIADIVFATRYPDRYGLRELKDMISFGGSPRASINLAKAARAYAFIKRRGYVVPEDVRAIAHDVLRHRIGLTYEAEASNVTSEEIVSKIINKVEVP